MIIAPGPASLRGFGAAENCSLFRNRSCVDWKNNQEKTMTKLSLIGLAAVAVTAAFTLPAFAQHRVAHLANTYAQSGVCGYQEPGNPYSAQEDYLAWSAWRARGGWDDRVDTNCLPGRMVRPGF
jgi:hypothetical protein